MAVSKTVLFNLFNSHDQLYHLSCTYHLIETLVAIITEDSQSQLYCLRKSTQLLPANEIFISECYARCSRY